VFFGKKIQYIIIFICKERSKGAIIGERPSSYSSKHLESEVIFKENTKRPLS